MNTSTLTTFLQTQELAYATMLKELTSPSPAELQAALATHIEKMKAILLATFPPKQTQSSASKSRGIFTTPTKKKNATTPSEDTAAEDSPTPRRTFSGPTSGMFSRVPLPKKKYDTGKDKEKSFVIDSDSESEAVEQEDSGDETFTPRKGKKRGRYE